MAYAEYFGNRIEVSMPHLIKADKSTVPGLTEINNIW